jgi:hypothetical protein
VTVFVESNLLQQLAKKSITKAELLAKVEADFDLLPQLFEGVSSRKAHVRYGCGGILAELTAKHPNRLYSHMDEFIALLDCKHRILVWNAMAAIANLCSVDTEKKFDAIFDKYYGFLKDEYLVTVANAVANSGKIALAKPYLIPKITEALLSVENISTTPHLTEECKRVVAGKAVGSFAQFYSKMCAEEKAKVMAFMKRHCGSPRKALKTKAECFLRQQPAGANRHLKP